MSKIERALLSVSDKTGIVDFARALADQGVELLSTGGTAKALRDAGLDVKDVSEFTGFPEMLDGRVKTLHPKVHAGLLYRRDSEEHVATMKEHGLEGIDLVCVNLYPFEETVAKPGVTFEDAIENIDIGGPTMLRSAAKNMAAVTVVCDPADYDQVLEEMQQSNGSTTSAFRIALARKVFARLAGYNAAITNYLNTVVSEENGSPAFVAAYTNGEKLRYGENPHQDAVFYKDAVVTEACIADAEILHGKEMSYNNYVDGDAALEAVRELVGAPGVAIIKHTNPCGYATGKTLAEAFEAAWAGDPVSSFGSVIAVTQSVDLAMAECTKGRFIEALIAPGFEPDALEFLKKKSKDLRLLKLNQPLAAAAPGLAIKQVNGGMLVQDRDISVASQFIFPTENAFSSEKEKLAMFGVKVCKHVKSNAIVIVREYLPGCFSLLGMGAGQPNRVDAVRKLAAPKARENMALMQGEYGQLPTDHEEGIIRDCVLVSDAFFPFPDNIENAAELGIRYIVQPGGSKRDEEVIAACDKYGIAMAVTGMRHFRH